MAFFSDQLNRTIQCVQTPRRIVSLVPSQTELLADLLLDDEVVGITKFCVHPERWFRSKTRIGGTKQLHIEKICALQPDLILANKEENERTQIEALARQFPVWISDINNLDDALEMIGSIGSITGREQRAQQIAEEIRLCFSGLPKFVSLPCAYLIWKDPYMTVGGDSFISALMQSAGLQNIFAHEKRYPVIDLETLKKNGCPLLLLSSEPYPFGEKHVDALRAELPRTEILLVDGEIFSWYGSRLRKAPDYFRQLRQQIISPKFGHAAGNG